MQKRTNVVYSVSSTILYNQLVGISIFSLLKNNSHLDEINIYIFESGIDSNEKEKINQEVREYGRNIYYIDVRPMLKDIEALNIPIYKGSYQLYIKYFIARYLPDEVESFLYLDADTIIDKRLDLLLQEFDNRKESTVVLAGSGILQGEYRKEIGIGYNNHSICVGVMFFDRVRWEKMQCLERFLIFIKEHELSNYRQLDEDAFNIAFRDMIEVASLKSIMFPCLMKIKPKYILRAYDFSERSFFDENQIENVQKEGAVIYHFIDLLGKPWEKYCVDPLKQMWLNYMRESLWNNLKIERNKSETVSHIFAKISYCVSKRLYSYLIRILKK